MKGSDSSAAFTSSINSTEAVEGQQGAEDTAPASRGDAEHGQLCLQLWPPQISVVVRALGLAGSSMGLGCWWWLHLPTQDLLPWASRPCSDFQPFSNPIDGVARDTDGIRAQQSDEALGICLRADPCSTLKGNGCF